MARENEKEGGKEEDFLEELLRATEASGEKAEPSKPGEEAEGAEESGPEHPEKKEEPGAEREEKAGEKAEDKGTERKAEARKEEEKAKLPPKPGFRKKTVKPKPSPKPGERGKGRPLLRPQGKMEKGVEKKKKEQAGKPKFHTYYKLCLLTLGFFTFLAVFVLVEFFLVLFNISLGAPGALVSLAPSVGGASLPLLFVGIILTMIDLGLHFWDSKRNLMLSFIPSCIMLGGLALTFTLGDGGDSADGALQYYLLFALLLLIVVVDAICIMDYPKPLERHGRTGLEPFIKTKEETKETMEALEEEVRLRTEALEDIRQQLDVKTQEFAEEEERLHQKETELKDAKSQLGLKEQELAEESERLKLKEEELSKITTDIEQAKEDWLAEEEEKLKLKEEELMKLRNDFEIKEKLFEESREKLVFKEQEIVTLRTELEKEIRARLEEEEKIRIMKATGVTLQKGRTRRLLYPFIAIVGQEMMKKALILNAIDPEIGGVLIQGQKGTAKSISVRGLAEILPGIAVVEGCRFNCDPEDKENLCPECEQRQAEGRFNVVKRPIKVIDLPLNTTEDRLLGSIDIERILREGTKAFEPGILAEAHRGILYVDEINLLDDYVVDTLLDAAAMGIALVEREGISVSYPAKFIIVGSMNPEEGELRPQLLDRLALLVSVKGITDIASRIEIVRRRERFTSNPEEFRKKFNVEQNDLRARIVKARETLPFITITPQLLEMIARLSMDFKVDGHRADIIIERAARANVAFDGRREVTVDDIIVAAEMALPHRMRRTVAEELTADVLKKSLQKQSGGG